MGTAPVNQAVPAAVTRRRTASRQSPLRQRVRRGLLLASLLLFPITLYYFSPYLIVEGAAQGIVTGSFLMFAAFFVSAVFVGRLWCGWACPGGALSDACAPVNGRAFTSRWARYIKWVIWLPWVSLIAVLLARAGLRSVEPLYGTTHGISVAQASAYFVYYTVIGLFVVLAVAAGRRTGCHTICWMAPFLILGRAVRNRMRLPALSLAARPEACVRCDKCTAGCPMSLDVQQMVLDNRMENANCILCSSCVDVCSKQAIRYTFTSRQNPVA